MKIKKTPPKLKLQPLRIPSVWEVSYNTMVELDPKEIGPDEEERWLNFTEDLLQLSHLNYKITLDVGWYPEADPNGAYGLEVIQGSDWSHPLFSFSTSNKNELVEKIELLLWQIGEGDFN